MRLSPAQRRALRALDHAVLRQYADLYARGVRWRTLISLATPAGDRPQLAQTVDLKPACWLKVPYHQFWRLTPAGLAARKQLDRATR